MIIRNLEKKINTINKMKIIHEKTVVDYFNELALFIAFVKLN